MKYRILLRITEWLERKMQRSADYSRNDPEWNELQNEVNALKRELRQREAPTMRRALTALGLIATLGLAVVGLVEIFPIIRTLTAWQAGCFG